MLAESQTVSQCTGLVFMQAGAFSGRSQGFGKVKWKHKPLANQNQGNNHLSLQYSFGSGSGYAPIVLGKANGRAVAAMQVTEQCT